MDNARKAAYFALRDVEENKAYSGFAVQKAVRKIPPERTAFVRELVYGTIREQLLLDNIIGRFIKTPVGKLPVSDRVLLRMGVYQHVSLNSVPDYAAVSETVELAKRYSRGREKFINGVLRQYIREKDRGGLPPRERDEAGYLSLKYSFARWIVEMWINEFRDVSEVEKLLAALNRRPRLCLRVGSLRTDTEGLLGSLDKAGFSVEADENRRDILFLDGSGSNKPLDSELYRKGFFSVQDKASVIAAASVGAKPGETIVDVCAAPGGKAMAMAEAMGNNGRIIALDIHEHRIGLIEAEALRLGVDIVETRRHDSRNMIPELENMADRVLVDTPCSGLGTARRKPEVKYKEFDESMEALPRTQLDILNASAGYVKPGGTLVYSTCTIAKRENGDVIDAFLCGNDGFEKADMFQLLPTEGETDGFFICRLLRKDQGHCLGERRYAD